MKVDNAFDKTELLKRLRTAYDLFLQSITFFPEGEDSYGYIATSETGEKYFVKASTSVPDTCPAGCITSTAPDATYPGVVAPLETLEWRAEHSLAGFSSFVVSIH